MKANRTAGILIALTIVLHGVLWWREGWHTSPVAAAKFAVPAPILSTATAAPLRREEFIDPQPAEAAAHVSSVCELPGGRLAAAWYAGTREGARDVVIYFATRAADPADGWSRPQRLVTRATAAAETFRFVRKVGNPMLFSSADGRVYLLYVSVGFGGWSSSSLNLKQSDDGGRTWSPSRRLGLSPFFNVSELVKNSPAPLADGGWVVPIYHELLGKFPELVWLHPRASGWEVVKTRAFGGRQAFQPALTPLDEQQALLFCRTAGAERKIHLARTSDGGLHWTPPQPIELPNSDSGLDALRLADGRLLLAFNDTVADRHILRLALSDDRGVTWKRAATIAEEAGAEFSYPCLLQTSDGLVHLTYTWKRRAIKHVTFNLAWLDAQAGAPSTASASWNASAETGRDGARRSGSWEAATFAATRIGLMNLGAPASRRRVAALKNGEPTGEPPALPNPVHRPMIQHRDWEDVARRSRKQNGARVCDPQRLRTGDRVRDFPNPLRLRNGCGSQSRAPISSPPASNLGHCCPEARETCRLCVLQVSVLDSVVVGRAPP